MVGDALIGVAFVRNICATIIVFSLTSWIEGMGLHNAFTVVGCLSLPINMLCVPLIIFGKRFRRACAPRYRMFADLQADTRN